MQLSPEDKRVLVVTIIKTLSAVLQDNKHAQVMTNHINKMFTRIIFTMRFFRLFVY